MTVRDASNNMRQHLLGQYVDGTREPVHGDHGGDVEHLRGGGATYSIQLSGGGIPAPFTILVTLSADSTLASHR